ncbi:MAG: hypothetical protein JSS02_05025 [Planctomycetes bacterium]|nr:hypothetical protein [Planctomycetota bacterium]
MTRPLANWLIGLGLLLTATVPPFPVVLCAQDDDEVVVPDDADSAEEVVPPAESDAEINNRFQVWVFGQEGRRSEPATRAALLDILNRRVSRLDRVCGLSDRQKHKLTTAGRGDIERLFNHIRDLRESFLELAREKGYNQASGRFANEISAIRESLKSGPFGPDSLLDRIENTILTPEQRAIQERRTNQLLNSTRLITATNAASLEFATRFPFDAFKFAWSPSAQQFGWLEFDKRLEIHAAKPSQPSQTLAAGRRPVNFDFSPQPGIVACGLNSRQAVILDYIRNQEIVIDTGTPQPAVLFSPDGKLLVTGGYGSRATLWSAETGAKLRDLPVAAPEGGLTPLFSPDGKILAVGNRNSTTRLFDVATGEVLRELPLRMTHELRFHPDGNRLAVAYVDGSLAVWDIETGKLIKRAPARAHAEELYSVDWSPDGSLLATAGLRGTVTLWSGTDLARVAELESPEWVICVRFHPAGTHLAFSGRGSQKSSSRYLEMWAVP